MRIAAIDLGSNSFQMLIAEIDGPSSFKPVVLDKMMIQLGRTALLTGRLDPNDMTRGLRCLTEFRQMALARRVERTIAVTTAVIREAENGEEFLRRAREASGFHIRPISGREEARLIHLAVSRESDLQERVLLADIGGGNLKLSVGDGQQIYFAAGLKLGFLRLQGRFVTRDPMSRLEARALASFLGETLRAPMTTIRKRGPLRVIATGGSAAALKRLVEQLAASSGHGQDRANRIRRAEIRGIINRLLELPAIERARQFDLDTSWAQYLPTALMILSAVLEGVGSRSVEISKVVLCEGVIHYYLQGRSTGKAPPAPGDPCMQAVLDLAGSCDYPAEHSHRVARLAGQIFRQTACLHGFGEYEGRLLEYASILHDIGYHVSYSRHHKHAHHLVMNCELRGFAPAERSLLANLVRYHRRVTPKASHAPFRALTTAEQRIITHLSAMLRIADALDVGHFCVIDDVQLRIVGKRIHFLLHANSMHRKVPLNLGSVKRRARYFERLLGVEAIFRVRRSQPQPRGDDKPGAG